jgi:hypothetical protein
MVAKTLSPTQRTGRSTSERWQRHDELMGCMIHLCHAKRAQFGKGTKEVSDAQGKLQPE